MGTKPKVCTIENCDRPVYATGWCNMHYRRSRILAYKGYGPNEQDKFKRDFWRVEMNKPPQGEGGVSQTCSVEGCTKPYKAKGLCQNHYAQQYYYKRKLEYERAIAALNLKETPPPEPTVTDTPEANLLPMPCSFFERLAQYLELPVTIEEIQEAHRNGFLDEAGHTLNERGERKPNTGTIPHWEIEEIVEAIIQGGRHASE